MTSQVYAYQISGVEPQSPRNYYGDRRILTRNQKVEKQFKKRFKIRKHGCKYLSVIADLMTGNQNYGKRSIDKEFKLLLDLHTGTGSTYRWNGPRS